MGRLKSKLSKACDIPLDVKTKVWERDNHACIVCGNPHAAPNAHFIPRSHGGLGIEQNIVTLCADCHRIYDQTAARPTYGNLIEGYLQRHYPDWDKSKLIYDKWRANNA